MKHYIYFLITAHVLFAATCIAMETKPHILAEITCIKKPQRALFLTNDRVVINGRNGCSIINVITNEEIIKIIDTEAYHIDVHPNKKKLAVSHNKTITIYDAETGIPEWTNTDLQSPSILSSIFNPLKSTILLRHTHRNEVFPGISKYNYITNKKSVIGYDDQRSTSPSLSFHPTKKEFCLAYNPGMIMILHSKKEPFLYDISTRPDHRFCNYSPDGSLLAIGNSHSLNIFTVHADHYQREQLEEKKEYDYSEIAFHPNSSVLATLSGSGNKLRYWDSHTGQLITKIKLYPFATMSLSFSPDGQKLIIALSNKCIIVSTPFEVMYQLDTKQRFPYLLFLLKNLNCGQSNELPRDLTPQLKYNLLEIFKR